MSQKIGWATSITDSKLTDVEGAATTNGQRSLRWVGDKAYRWVYNATTVALVAGDVVVFGTTDLTKANIYTLGQAVVTTFAGSEFGVVTSTALASLSYGWVQVYGYNASVNIIGTAAVVAVNEVQAFTFTTVPSAGSYYLQIGNKSTKILAYNDVAATVQTALDAALGTANAIVVTGDGFAGANKNLILTFSGTGYAGRPITENVSINTVVALTAGAATGPFHTITTAGVTAVAAAVAVGDILVPTSGQKYLTKTAVAGASAVKGPYAQAVQAYTTAAPALKGAIIMGLL